MSRVLVTSADGAVGALAADALARLDTPVEAIKASPRGTLAERSAEWMHIIDDVDPQMVFVNDVVVGLGRQVVDSADVAVAALAACARTDSVRRVVVVSSGEIYGSDGAQPTFVTEAQRPVPPVSATTAALRAVEDAAAELGMARPDMQLAILRPTEILGETPLGFLAEHVQNSGRYVGAEAGFDPQVQFMTDHDFAVICLAALTGDACGVYNIAPAGALPLADALEAAGRVRVPSNRPMNRVASILRGSSRWSRELTDLLTFGRALDASRAASVGWTVPSGSLAAVAALASQ